MAFFSYCYCSSFVVDLPNPCSIFKGDRLSPKQAKAWCSMVVWLWLGPVKHRCVIDTCQTPDCAATSSVSRRTQHLSASWQSWALVCGCVTRRLFLVPCIPKIPCCVVPDSGRDCYTKPTKRKSNQPTDEEETKREKEKPPSCTCWCTVFWYPTDVTAYSWGK